MTENKADFQEVMIQVLAELARCAVINGGFIHFL
jgi:hypothetical protein